MSRISWSYYKKFSDVTNKYLTDVGEGTTKATQIVTAINNLVYKWYNDGDVYDNVHSYLNGWCNDLSSYANWIYENVPSTRKILMRIYHTSREDEYEHILSDLADELLQNEKLEMENEKQSVGSIYKCDGPFEFNEFNDGDDEWF